MRIGKLDVYVLQDGTMRVDGGAIFGQVPRMVWERYTRPDRRNRVRLGLNCLLVRAANYTLLVDCGVGTKEPERVRDLFGLGPSKLQRNLRALGLTPRDVDAVVLTHLHFDHAGGATKYNRRNEPVPTFPRATYFVQRTAWEDAINPNERSRAAYHADDFLPLETSKQLVLLDGDKEISPGVWVKVTNGHTRGHQIVLIHHGGSCVAFLGDLVPTPYHLQLPYIAAVDQYPEDTLEQKRTLLALAEKEGWLVVFSHGLEQRAGFLERRDGRLHLRPVDL